MTRIADLQDRLLRLARRREDEGIYTDANLVEAASARIAALEAQLAERAGGVKPLDEDDYEKIISAAAINMRKATSGVRGQMVTAQDSLDWWVMKETERRILSTLTTEPAAPEGRQDDEPRAYIVHAPEDDYYGTGPDRLQFHPLAQHDMNNGYRQTPLYGRPAHELSGDKDREIATLRARVEELEREVERAFRDGIAYATVCDVTDVDLAWQSSAARDRLTNIMGESDG